MFASEISESELKSETETEPVKIYIEIEKFSNVKYEYNKETNKLEVDRILNDPYKYPYPYGFILNTLASDNDELDALIITNKQLKTDAYYNAHIIGALYMEDEKGVDEKVLCVLDEDYNKIRDVDDLTEEVKKEISEFFANYKNNTKDKWSKVGDLINKKQTIQLYKQYKTYKL